MPFRKVGFVGVLVESVRQGALLRQGGFVQAPFSWPALLLAAYDNDVADVEESSLGG